MKQPEAIQLANEMRENGCCHVRKEAAAELRRLAEVEKERDRLHEANQAMLEALKDAVKSMGGLTEGDICQASHHKKEDRHGAFSPCPVTTKFVFSFNKARAAIAKGEQQ